MKPFLIHDIKGQLELLKAAIMHMIVQNIYESAKMNVKQKKKKKLALISCTCQILTFFFFKFYMFMSFIMHVSAQTCQSAYFY